MSSSEKAFKHESYQDGETVVKYLKSVAEGLHEGRLVLGTGEDEVTLEPDGLMKLEIKAKRKGSQHKLSLKVSWKEGEKGQPDAESSSLPETGASDDLEAEAD